jgi:hypothetical protein
MHRARSSFSTSSKPKIQNRFSMPGPISSFTPTESLSERRLADPSLPVPPRKKRVIVTGGSGKLGRWVVREMVDHGWEVFNGAYRDEILPWIGYNGHHAT